MGTRPHENFSSYILFPPSFPPSLVYITCVAGRLSPYHMAQWKVLTLGNVEVVGSSHATNKIKSIYCVTSYQLKCVTAITHVSDLD